MSEIYYIRCGKLDGMVHVVFLIKYNDGQYKWWLYPVQFEDVMYKIRNVASGFKNRRGESVPPNPPKALTLAKEWANGKEFEITQSEEHFHPEIAEINRRIKEKATQKSQEKPPDIPTCKNCGKDLHEDSPDYCDYCGKRANNWYTFYKFSKFTV